MRRVLYVVVYVTLTAVVVSCLRSVWIGVLDVDRYQAVFPSAVGPLRWLTILTSLLAAANAVLVGLRMKWAILANPCIGLASIILLRMAHGPVASQVVVLMATTLSTVVPWYLWIAPPMGHPARGT